MRLQRAFFLSPDTSGQGSLFYDISRYGMHHRRLGKTQGVAEGHIPEIGPGFALKNRSTSGRRPAGQLAATGWFAIVCRPDIMRPYKIIVLF